MFYTESRPLSKHSKLEEERQPYIEIQLLINTVWMNLIQHNRYNPGFSELFGIYSSSWVACELQVFSPLESHALIVQT